MKHSLSKRSNAEQLETCGIWLDTAKLKKRKVQILLSKPTSYVPNPLLEKNYNSNISINLAQPCTKQTTISSFFSVQQTGEKDKHLKPNSFVSNTTPQGKSSDSLAPSSLKSCVAKSVEVQDPTFSPQAAAIQEYSQPLVQNTQELNMPLLNEAQYKSTKECTATARISAGDTEDSIPINFTQDSEGSRVLAHRNADDSFPGRISVETTPFPREREGYWTGEKDGHLRSNSGNIRMGLKPKHVIKQSRRCKNLLSSGISFVDFSDVENIKPALKGKEGQQTTYPLPQGQMAEAELLKVNQSCPKTSTRNYYTMAGSAEEWGVSKNSSTMQLFTQDSEGYKVMSHQHFDKNARSPSQKKCLQDKTNSVQWVTSPPPTSCFKTYSSRPSGRTPLTTTVMNLCEPDLCYELLFTEDLEGNRMIKH